MVMQSIKVKEFLKDLRSGMSSSELICKYQLTNKGLDEICRKLNRRDLSALKRLWEQEKLSESQFMRAFAELEDDLDGKG
ncbi:MAG TPA: hypothetical protein VK463_03430 [Desulfomonilaceae bacterium]|nr:hypothetical protein [Desulfomonilaceae bacterium]